MIFAAAELDNKIRAGKPERILTNRFEKLEVPDISLVAFRRYSSLIQFYKWKELAPW
jgi:hypothetical protein